MDIRQLRYFSVLAEEKHFGRAARKLSLSQPPLSHAIRMLETELDAKLFTRNTRAVRLTRAGAALQIEALALLRRIEEVRQQVRQVALGRSGRIRMGFGGSMLYRGLPEILDDVAAALPGVDIALTEMGSVAQIEALHRDEIDLGFIHSHATPDGLDGFLYHEEPFVACVPATHRLAGARRIKLHQLRQDDFILFARHGSPAYYSSIVGTCLAAGFAPNVRHEVAFWLSVVSLVANGLGVALVPQSLRNSQLAGACFAAIDQTAILSQTYCVWKTDRLTDAGLANTLEVIRARAPARQTARRRKEIRGRPRS